MALALPSAKEARKPDSIKSPVTGRPELKLLEEQSDALIVEWRCPEIIVSRDEATNAVTGIEMPGAESVTEVGVPQLPSLVQLLDCYPGPVTATILDSDVETQQLGAMLPMPEDVVVDPRPADEGDGRGSLDEDLHLTFTERRANTPLRPGTWPTEILTVHESGVYRGHRLVAVQFLPVQVNTDQGTARIIKRARIRITMPHGSNLESRRADAAPETELVRAMLGPLGRTAIPTRMTETSGGRGGPIRNLDDEPIGGRWKLIVNTEGIVRIPRGFLDSVGVPVDQISPFDTHIRNRGHEIPIYFAGEADGHFDDADYIDFYGLPNRQTYQAQNPVMYTDPFTDDNVYWLSWGDGNPGLRIGQMTVGWFTDTLNWPSHRIRIISSVKNKVHAERDEKHDRLAEAAYHYGEQFEVYGPLGVHEDHWFWGDWIDGLTTRDFNVSLPFPNTRSFRNVKVRAALMGFSQGGSVYGSHRAMVSLDGVTAPGLTVGRISRYDSSMINWHDQTPIILESRTDTAGITTDQLVDGTNVISVTLPGDGLAGPNDKIYANWFEIEYDRELRASHGYITFDFDTTLIDTFAIDIRGFNSPDIEIWDLDGHVRLTGFSVHYVQPADESPSWAARFHLVTTRPYRFHMFDQRPEVVTPPFAAYPEVSTTDLRTQTGARYVMIYYDGLALDEVALAAMNRLDSLRQASFFGQTMMVPLSTIYEQFNYGIVSPYAIHDFLTYAYDHWQVRPTHCCLIGDGVLVTKGYHGTGNMIPSFYSQTFGYAIGICAADMLFGCVSGPAWDMVPDIAIGRISARSGAELQTYVDKVYNYETVSDYNGIFRSTVMFVADTTSDFDFINSFSEPIVRVLDDDANISRIYLDSIATGQGPNELRDAMRDPGAVVVNYNGHGGGGVWGKSNIMDVGGVRLLRNRRGFPFITNFTCFVGAFDDRNQTAVLGEAFIFSRSNDGDLVGGIGVYSSSGVGWALTGVNMQRYLFNFIAERPPLTLGDILNVSKTRFWAVNTGFQPRWVNQAVIPFSQLVMMNLLGDPGVKLTLPRYSFNALSADTTMVSPGDSIQVTGDLPWVPIPGGSQTDIFILPYNGDRFDSTGFVSSKVPIYNVNNIIEQSTTTSHFSFPVAIGPRFNTPDGKILVHAVDRDLKLDAMGSIPIFNADSLTNLRILDMVVVPDGFVYSDSTFRLQVRIAHENGIESVRMRGVFRPAQGPIVLDTVAMQQIGPGLWESPLLGPYHTAGGAYQVTFYAKPFGENIQAMSPRQVPLEQLTDFLVDTGGILQPEIQGRDRSYFYLPVTHRRFGNNRPIPSVDVTLFGISDSTVIIGGDTTVFVIDSFTTATVTVDIPDEVTSLSEVLIPVTLRPRPYRFTATIDPDQRIPETSELNNTYQLSVTQPAIYSASNAFGTFYSRPLEQHAYHRYWVPSDTLWLRAAPGSLPNPTAAFVYSGPETLSTAELNRLVLQSMFRPIPGRAVRAFPVRMGDSSEALSPAADVEVMMNIGLVPVDTLRHIAIFQKRSESENWHRLENISFDTLFADTLRRCSGRFHGTSRGLGKFALFRVTDQTGPVIDFSADGIPFTPGSILPRRPAIYTTLNDINGIDRRTGRFYVILDNDTLPESEISWSDTLQTGGGMSALIRPQLEPGTHTISAYATDNIGNVTRADATFEVSGQFGIEWAINYPNPFSKRTQISYLLTDVTDQFVEVKIYTVAGRHIRTLRETDQTAINYRSIVWDGTDDSGEEVANGVYFARLKAKQGDHEVEKTIKMAKVR